LAGFAFLATGFDLLFASAAFAAFFLLAIFLQSPRLCKEKSTLRL
jgi:hypothetical protein